MLITKIIVVQPPNYESNIFPVVFHRQYMMFSNKFLSPYYDMVNKANNIYVGKPNTNIFKYSYVQYNVLESYGFLNDFIIFI